MTTTNSGSNWLLLIAGIILIGIFIFVAAPFVENHIAPMKQLSGYIDAHEVNMCAYTYADSELSAHAAFGARNTMEHMPVGPKQSKEAD